MMESESAAAAVEASKPMTSGGDAGDEDDDAAGDVVGLWETARVDEKAAASPTRWVFGYGSLIWKVDFPTTTVGEGGKGFPCVLEGGFRRRFWMRSSDHRGTIDRPGRVVTLVRRRRRRRLRGAEVVDDEDVDDEDERFGVPGVAYEIPESRLDEALKDLDHRERHGYTRTIGRVRPIDDNGGNGDGGGSSSSLPESMPNGGEVFVYHFDDDTSSDDDDDNDSSSSSSAFVRGEHPRDTARIIATASGASGPNVEYLRNLVRGVRELNNSSNSTLGESDEGEAEPYLEDLLDRVENELALLGTAAKKKKKKNNKAGSSSSSPADSAADHDHDDTVG